MAFDPEIKSGKYQTGVQWWGFDLVLPSRKRDRSRYSTRREAEVHRLHLMKQFRDGGGMTSAELVDAQDAYYALREQGITLPMTHVARHFIESYKPTTEKPLSEYSIMYLARKKAKGKAPSTLQEIELYLRPFVKLFGHQKPSEISSEAIDLYLADNSCRRHRDKVLRGLFDWLAGRSKRMAALKDLPLQTSPFIHIDQPPQAVGGTPVILYVEEVKALIIAAIGTDQLAWVVWGLFTASRPLSEARAMWSPRGPKHEKQCAKEARIKAACDKAWRHIDFARRTATIFSGKLRGRSRPLILQPNLIEWLKYFQSKGITPKFSKRNYRELKAAVPAKAKVQDILRHTGISNLCKLCGPSGTPMYTLSDVAAQCGTSVQMIEKHYLAQISEPKAVEEFWSLTPKSFGLV